MSGQRLAAMMRQKQFRKWDGTHLCGTCLVRSRTLDLLTPKMIKAYLPSVVYVHTESIANRSFSNDENGALND
jgi:hypothetical protein